MLPIPERPPSVPDNAIPITVWDTTQDMGDNALRSRLLAQGWEPTNGVMMERKATIIGAPNTGEFAIVWFYRRQVGVQWAIPKQQGAINATS